VLGFVLGAGVVVYLIVTFFPADDPDAAVPPPGAGVPEQPPVADQIVTAGLGGLLLLGAIVGVVVLAALWMRRARPPDDDPVEESRTIDRGSGDAAPRLRRRAFGRRPEPVDAAGAYVALVADLERHPAVRREDAETPAEHAARLRRADRTDLRLDLLAADYALARFAGVTLPEREHRRAVGRWRLLRRRLVREPPRRRTGETAATRSGGSN
jgi:hypothetical protein